MNHITSNKGLSAILLILIIIVAFFAALIGADYGYIYYLEECGDEPVKTCLLDSEDEKENGVEEEGEIVTATGGISEKGYSASITLTFPLEGGKVTGSVSGDCSGKVEGVYSGGNGGTISGKIFGSCKPFLVPIPAKGTFSGIVNWDSNAVPITGTGSAAGFSGSRSLNLSY